MIIIMKELREPKLWINNLCMKHAWKDMTVSSNQYRAIIFGSATVLNPMSDRVKLSMIINIGLWRPGLSANMTTKVEFPAIMLR